ncbi:MAG: hypothetical protein A2381_17135 [Bdellovibrionales bacterium RIFOXYB1_FULL_37_110]|nr:MAG: hypothetical protein A2181_08140 [Bdellovibrionales bacterium RIFOXYA1_FULL_38_20]OFZ50121.1 MAG: hypothetical protein A2417_18970 [Bdellovibrionales bacterium RIFOXYC1_FULL_37_79]OFZ60027.1 MAG: hypothetical protein A2381_17135 [Bdellovibrionales bacterium RIFOXYB1_FULL_37_110]OFZ64250.1 MAG: hypothetical protein A2577_12520 [Bdellovibrionales bacterium RIFOXYD1_FULL_36_51]
MVDEYEKNILFDLDGTLTDPKVGITKSISYALNILKLPVPDNLDWCIGPPLQNSFAQLLGASNPALVQPALKLYRERFVEKGMYENEVYPGIEDFLEKLTDIKFKMYVATSKPEVYAKKIIKHFNLEKYFAGVYGSELSGKDCDKAVIISNVLEYEKISNFKAVMIGDRSHDLIGAKANGMDAIGVLWGYGSKEEFAPENPYAMVKNLMDLEQVIISWSKRKR